MAISQQDYDSDEGAEPFRLVVNYDPMLDNIHDKISGTQTQYREVIIRDPLTNQPRLNSAGKPLTYMKQEYVPKAGVKPLMNQDGVEQVMECLQTVVNRATTMASMSLSDIVYACNITVSALNDNITLNSQIYGIENMAAWFSQTKIIRNFLFNYLSAIKNGGFREWSENILGVRYDRPVQAPNMQRKQGVLERLFSRRQMVDNNASFGD